MARPIYTFTIQWHCEAK